MDFLKILRSFEEFIVEATSWLIFYPLTLWRVLRHPMRTMDYSDREQADSEEHRYDDAVSPPLTLLATIVLANVVAAGLHVAPPESSSYLLQPVIQSQQNLVLFRCLLFSLAPLVAAVTLVRRQNKKLSRENLRDPFYAQCYLAAPFAAAISVGGVFVQRADLNSLIGGAIMIGALIWFLACQAAWFDHKLSVGRVRAVFIALGAMARALIYLIAILVPMVLF